MSALRVASDNEEVVGHRDDQDDERRRPQVAVQAAHLSFESTHLVFELEDLLGNVRVGDRLGTEGRVRHLRASARRATTLSRTSVGEIWHIERARPEAAARCASRRVSTFLVGHALQGCYRTGDQATSRHGTTLPVPD